MTANLDRLLDVMAQLRDPEKGCPWDVEQTFATIAPYTIEEAYEVADAISQGDMEALREELGDLLLQVAFHSRMAEEDGAFDFDAVAAGIADKMIRRHPYVFGDETMESVAAQTIAWEDLKKQERQAKAEAQGRVPSVLDGVPVALPGLTRAEKLCKRAARVGFDWPDAGAVFAKLDEELGELRHEVDNRGEAARIEDEMGDLLFSVANLARHLGIDPEAAIRGANAKFEHRFHHIEDRLRADGRAPEDASLDEMDRLWNEAKAGDRAGTGAPERLNR